MFPVWDRFSLSLKNLKLRLRGVRTKLSIGNGIIVTLFLFLNIRSTADYLYTSCYENLYQATSPIVDLNREDIRKQYCPAWYCRHCTLCPNLRFKNTFLFIFYWQIEGISGAVGGLMGLYLGISAVSALEIIIFLFKVVIYLFTFGHICVRN